MEIPKSITEFMNKFITAGYQIFIVGGAVRDLLMGRVVSDWDFTTDANPDEIQKLFPDSFYDNSFGTVGIPISPVGDGEEGSRRRARNDSEDGRRDSEPAGPADQQIFEVTTMRREGEYKDFRHPTEIDWTDKIEEDLKRRDFTINAMALSFDGKIIDLFGGQKDLEQRLIKAVGNPDTRFQEDALRIIKAFRLVSQLEFEIETETLNSIVKNKQLILNIASERIRDELFKLLGGLNPYIGILKLREAGILETLLPELEKCFGVVQEGPKHARVYDVGEHSLLSLKMCPSIDALVRLATLLHDIGKPDTKKVASDGNVTFYNHDLVGEKLVLNIARRLNLSKKQTDKLCRLVRWHLFTVDEQQTDSAIRRFITNIGQENIEDMITLRIGDRLGGGTERAVSWRMEEFQKRIKQVLTKPFSVSDLKVNGTDVMKVLKISPGRKVGEILEQLFQEVLEDNSKNKRDYLLSRIEKYQ